LIIVIYFDNIIRIAGLLFRKRNYSNINLVI